MGAPEPQTLSAAAAELSLGHGDLTDGGERSPKNLPAEIGATPGEDNQQVWDSRPRQTIIK